MPAAQVQLCKPKSNHEGEHRAKRQERLAIGFGRTIRDEPVTSKSSAFSDLFKITSSPERSAFTQCLLNNIFQLFLVRLEHRTVSVRA